MASLDVILTVFAFVLFVVAAYPRNFIAAGLACLTATLLF